MNFGGGVAAPLVARVCLTTYKSPDIEKEALDHLWTFTQFIT